MSVLARTPPRTNDQGGRRRTGPGKGRGGRLARWSSTAIAIAGVWLLIAPWTLDYGSRPTAAIWNSAVVGVLIVGVALVKVARPGLVGISWLNVGLGGWLVMSPWVLGESGGSVEHTAGNINMVVVGMVVMALAVTSSAGTFVGRGMGERRC